MSEKMPGVRDHLNAFLDLPDLPVEHVPSGPLSGLTFGVKEIYDVVGYKTTFGNQAFYETAKISTKNSPIVQALLNAGAKFIGKTQTEEFAWSLSGLDTHLPPAINPRASTRATGGSSSGSVAAVAGGLVDIALGTDTVGSIRGPASFTGLIGLRPTYGRLSLDGILPGSPTFDAAGWFAKDMETYEKVAQVLLSPTSQSSLPIDQKVHLIRLPDHENVGLLGPEEHSAYQKMLTTVESVLGTSKLEHLEFSTQELANIIGHLRAYEAWEIFGEWFSEKPRHMRPAVEKKFKNAALISKETATKDRESLTRFRQYFKNFMGKDKIVVLPTTPSCSLLRTSTDDEWYAYRNRAASLLGMSPLTGCPEITIPIGTVHDAPFGISLLGPENSDELLINLAKKILAKV